MGFAKRNPRTVERCEAAFHPKGSGCGPEGRPLVAVSCGKVGGACGLGGVAQQSMGGSKLSIGNPSRTAGRRSAEVRWSGSRHPARRFLKMKCKVLEANSLNLGPKVTEDRFAICVRSDME